MRQFLLSFIFFSAVSGWSQDTLWVDKNSNPIENYLAEGYRIDLPNKDKTFTSTEYYITGKKKYERTATEKFGDIFIGSARFYNEEGKIATIVNIVNNKLEGKAEFFLKDGTKSEGIYKNGELYNGTVAYETEDYRVTMDVKDGNYNYTGLFGINNPKIGQKIFYKGKIPTRIISYDKDGKVIGDTPLIDGAFIDGIMALYDYYPFTLINTYVIKNQKTIEKSYYFKNGKVKQRTIEPQKDKNGTDSFYDQNGQIIAELEMDLDDFDSSNPKNGTMLLYFTDDPKNGQDSDNVEFINLYKNYELIQVKQLRPDGSILKIDYYDDFGEYLKTENYDTKSNLSHQLTYYNESSDPYEGTQITENSVRVYQAGNIISETLYYNDKTVFKKFEGKQATFYDKKGKIIGKLEYYDPYNKGAYEHYYAGDAYSLEKNTIKWMSRHQNGKLVYKVEYFSDKELLPLKETFYTENDITRELEYYKNGKTKSDILFSDSREKKGTFFDNKGKKISEFDYVKLDGTRYTFFEETDMINTIEKYTNGTLQYEKVMTYNPSTPSIPTIIREIDYNKSGIFNVKGKPTYTATYKNGKPYNGKVVTNDGGEYNYKRIENYVNGFLDGEQLLYDEQAEELVRITVYIKEKLVVSDFFNNSVISITPYVNGFAHGEAIYYDADGKETAKVTYENGEAIDGTEVRYENGIITSKIVYRNGEVIEKYTFTNNALSGKVILLDESEQRYQTETYHSDGKLKIHYTEKGALLDGKVLYINAAGKKEYEATMKDGAITNGTLWIEPIQSFNKTNPKYIKIEKNNNTIILTGIGKNGNVTFTKSIISGAKKNSVLSEIEELSSDQLYLAPEDMDNTTNSNTH